jgi:hypothetical protein
MENGKWKMAINALDGRLFQMNEPLWEYQGTRMKINIL